MVSLFINHSLKKAHGESFEELVSLGLHDPHHGVNHRAIVDRVRQIVGVSRGAEIGGELEVDRERLRARLLFGQHAVDTQDLQTLDENGAHSGARDSRHPATHDAFFERDRHDLAANRTQFTAGESLDQQRRVRSFVN